MAAPLIRFEWRDNGLVALASGIPARLKDEARKVVAATTERMFQAAKHLTPVDSGRAMSRWRIEMQPDGKSGRIVNDTDYINVLEFGGYPVRALSRVSDKSRGFVRGRALLGGQFQPGPRTAAFLGGSIPMANNVSRQATTGMVRTAVAQCADQFEFDLAEALDRALNGGR